MIVCVMDVSISYLENNIARAQWMIIRINISGFVLQGRPLHPRRVRGAAGADSVRPHHRGDRAQRPRVQREAEQCHRPVNWECEL